MKLSEAETQVLATLQKTGLDAQSTDQASLEKQGERYWIFLEDWSDAFSSLTRLHSRAACPAGRR